MIRQAWWWNEKQLAHHSKLVAMLLLESMVLCHINVIKVTLDTFQVEMENMTTKKKYTFHCGQWLAKSEGDGAIVRELPAEGDDIKKPEPGLCVDVLIENLIE